MKRRTRMLFEKLELNRKRRPICAWLKRCLIGLDCQHQQSMTVFFYFLHVQLLMRPLQLKILACCPELPKWDKHLLFTSLSDTTSILLPLYGPQGITLHRTVPSYPLVVYHSFHSFTQKCVLFGEVMHLYFVQFIIFFPSYHLIHLMEAVFHTATIPTCQHSHDEENPLLLRRLDSSKSTEKSL